MACARLLLVTITAAVTTTTAAPTALFPLVFSCAALVLLMTVLITQGPVRLAAALACARLNFKTTMLLALVRSLSAVARARQVLLSETTVCSETCNGHRRECTLRRRSTWSCSLVYEHAPCLPYPGAVVVTIDGLARGVGVEFSGHVDWHVLSGSTLCT